MLDFITDPVGAAVTVVVAGAALRIGLTVVARLITDNEGD